MDNQYIARSLSLKLGKRRVIDNVSLALQSGEVTALIGPNGAGKSTLLRLLTGFLTADSGEQHIEGKALSTWPAPALSRRRAVMLQRTQLNANWPVETVIAMGRAPWGARWGHGARGPPGGRVGGRIVMELREWHGVAVPDEVWVRSR